MQLLSKAIYGILTANTDITDTVGSGNIWHTKIPQRTTGGSDAPVPLSIYFYTYAIDPVGSTKSGASQVDEHKLRVVIVGQDDDDMGQMAQYVRYSLDRVEPGYYYGIEIQGSEFLNATFDPEGSYELENQSWVLDFSFRVIDNDIRDYTTLNGMNYSLNEQIWPYSKWLNDEPIYWRTWQLGVGVDTYENLEGFTTDTVSIIVNVTYITRSIDDGETNFHQHAPAEELKLDGTQYSVYTVSNFDLHNITIWYTKI